MHFISKSTYLSLLIILFQPALGQRKLNGTYIRIESSLPSKKTEETIVIKKDSIWVTQKKSGTGVLLGEKFVNMIGTIYYHKTGYNNGPFYSGWLMVMSCDTCPEFWKYTLKSEDSLNIETHFWTKGKRDTIIKNGDTTYITPEFIEVGDPTDLNRVRELIFTVTNSGDILLNNKLYTRRKKKSY